MRTSLADSFAWCRSLARRTAGNFYFSFLTLPADRFRDMCALYAFMRITDDLGDDERLPAGLRAQHLEEWQPDVARALDGTRTEREGLPALADVVQRHAIPHEYLFAVIEGVRRDLEPTEFATFDELADYCYHVAGAVGLCCIHVWGFRGDSARQRAIDCGIAFQLTNILRDLGEDAEMGRLYLPREDLDRFGCTRDSILKQTRDEPFRRLMQFEANRAQEHYSRATALFENLDPPGVPIYAAMLRIYNGLLREIERRDYDVFTSRIRLPRWRKLAIAMDCIIRYRILRMRPKSRS